MRITLFEDIRNFKSRYLKNNSCAKQLICAKEEISVFDLGWLYLHFFCLVMHYMYYIYHYLARRNIITEKFFQIINIKVDVKFSLKLILQVHIPCTELFISLHWPFFSKRSYVLSKRKGRSHQKKKKKCR